MSKKEDVLNTALRLFNEHGYHAVGVDRICDEAQVSKMTLYKYFPNKNLLIEAVLKQRHQEFVSSLEDHLRTKDTPTDKLNGLFEWHMRWFASDSFYGCMFIKAASEFHQEIDVLTVSKEHKQFIYDCVYEVLTAIDIPYERELVANFIQIVLDGMIVSASIFQTREKIESAWRTVVSYLNLPYVPLADNHSGSCR